VNTDWQAVVFVAVLIVVPMAGYPLIYRGACRDMELLRRRLADPQCGAAPGTGVERAPSDVAALPRSPQAPADAVDPRPGASAGPQPPEGAAGSPSPAFSGLQPPVGLTGLPPVPTGARRRVVAHG
jgi:hypothetical protein